MTQHCSVAGWIDRTLMQGHLYRKDFDPEGLLSTLPAIATTLLGTLAGEFLRGATQALAYKLARTGHCRSWAGVAAGYAWRPWFPSASRLWTGFYVLFYLPAQTCLTLARLLVAD